MKTKRTLIPRLAWDSSYDDNDNTVLEAVGGSTDGESGDLYYRIKQELRNNQHVWVEDSSPELMTDCGGPRRWRKKHEARKAIQIYHNGIAAEIDRLNRPSVKGAK